ncbi:MAG TPA: DUF1254 domain-containing protein [Rhizomicrobium sp.]|nr:DUF1254 domain-containing protein [Rhizomicrobium sp.]
MPATARTTLQPIQSISAETALEIALEAYIYAYPLVLMEITRRVMTNVPAPDGRGHAPANAFDHRREFPDARFADVVRPNADTLYSTLWFDVSSEPLVVRLPDSRGRYHVMQLMDMWTDVFAAPGSRTTGDHAQAFAITGPHWMGPPLRGVAELRSPTAQGWLIGRTQTNGKSDYMPVHVFQDGMSAVPMSRYGKPYVAPEGRIDPEIDMRPPPVQLEAMEAADFFALFARATRLNPPHANDYPQLARLGQLGLQPGRPFDLGATGPVAQNALEAAPRGALRRIAETMHASARRVNGWDMPTSPVGTYGTDYLRRASVAFHGLGANTMEDAIYPMMEIDANGRPLDSAQPFALHFAVGQLPPARAFWSLTLYNEDQLFTENPLNRYAIGDRDRLHFNEDGSLDIYIQRDDPGGRKTANWLPSPQQGAFSLTLRIYWPRPQACDGTWKPPPLVPTRG